jgi:ATP-dependent helicase/DNAse subunit B
MAQDKYAATWISHSSIGDFLKCPRLYYLHNVYKDPKTGRKVTVINPSLALGQIVHQVLEALSVLPAEKRFENSLLQTYKTAWISVTGEKGGFKTKEEEQEYFQRGERMLQRVIDNPGPIGTKAIKIQNDLPNYFLSPEEQIILCGKVDWLEYLPGTDSVHIIDFKTGKNEEDNNSLQLPIYHLLVHNCQKRQATKASYWYLETQDMLTEKELPSLEDAEKHLLHIGKQIKLARAEKAFHCRRNGCYYCKPYEQIISGGAKFVGVGEYKQDMYII